MAKGYYLVQGDRTTCGGIIIEGEPTHTLFGKPLARERDQVTCGQYAGKFFIAGGIETDTIFGRKIAGTLDSKSTCPCQARLVPSILTDTYEKASGASSNEPEQRAQSAHAVQAAYKNKADPEDEPAPSAVNVKSKEEDNQKIMCHHSDGATDIAHYIVAEIKNNVRGDTAERIRELIDKDSLERKYQEWDDLPWYLKSSPPPEQNLLAAMTLWYQTVKTGAIWDHKQTIRHKFKSVAVVRPLDSGQISETYYHKYKNHDYYIDVWSNIHYGYVGLSVGFTESLLLAGSSLEQNMTPGAMGNDTVDDITSMKIGFSLYKTKGRFAEELTFQNIIDALESTPDNRFPKSRDTHWCWNVKVNKLL
ncbi:hypothetical protein CYR55_05910 [Chimaeribacter californicus]|uniref:Bacterial toxin 44 domain-containing protein n=1 Tax=Chimaeribacter californicus TaxID=2060067 RepID=A0A2N5EE64_9GAMM|nr:polymorphic toxin type 44 domain-containing protein [Chimaeribacter californicus]PLR40811.1 hypothetical protein CYR55_05910 [Chimaeribacter californicus]